MSKKITNPFGEESSDDDDDFNPFAKKKSSSNFNSNSNSNSNSVTNPFETNHTVAANNNNSTVNKTGASTGSRELAKPIATSNVTSNPFDDVDDNYYANTATSSGPTGALRTTATAATTKNTNHLKSPFDDNDNNDEDRFAIKTTNHNHSEHAANKNKPVNFNPFDAPDDNHRNNDEFGRQPTHNTILVAPSPRPSQIKRNKTIQTANKGTATSSNNPFDAGDKSTEQKRPLSRPNTLHERSKTQPLISSPNQNNNAFQNKDESNNYNKHKQNATTTSGSLTNNGIFDNSKSNNAEPSSLKSWLRGSITDNNTNESSTTTTTTTTTAQPKISLFSTPNHKANKSSLSLSLQSNTNNVKSKSPPNQSISINNNTSSSPERRIKSPKRKKKNFIVQCWPYDNYHQEQKEYYTSLQERSTTGSSYYDKHGTPSSPGSNTVTPSSNNSKKKKKKNLFRKKNKDLAEANGGYYSDGDDDNDDKPNASTLSRSKSIGGNGENQLFERPQDLPSIKEAVQNLSLFDFENKAEERAVVIVSTWLYDAGLIDELLANGGSSDSMGMGVSSPRNGLLLNSNMDAQTVSSVRSSEGIEVGVHGFPLEGGLKIDKEVEKLRASAQRELTLINTRLNDGVAASGAEVKEMVDAVQATRMDLGRLRELVTYISSGYKKDGFGNESSPSKKGRTDENSKDDGSDDGMKVILSNFPRLKRAINARRNIFRCFRELEFFSQIPLTCDTLREELHAGEWTEHEFTTIRNVCMEHVKLEILLVEAEAGMKTWLDDEDVDDDASMPSLRSNRSLRRHWKGKRAALTSSHYNVVDNFLSQHVKNVWELGDEIRVRILSGIGSAFELALKNPSGMVALVEAVEVYEQAAEQYKASHRNEDDEETTKNNNLHFTNMRAAALAQLYTDFELRGLEVFRAIHMQAADLADEKDALSSQFNAVMRAATELVTEIDVVKNQMAPCFAPHWRVEMLWSACVAHVCSNQIIQQIGGPEGQHLPDLTVTQLLDLVAWVEYFRETIEDAFPAIGQMHSKRTYFDERPDLFAGDDKAVNMENATDIIAWTNNMLWDVHRLAQDEFLLRTRGQVDELLTKVYNANHETYQTNEMRLISSLCEDVFSLVGIHLRTIRERLTKKSDALVMTVCLIFSQLRSKQMKYRDSFLKDLDTCCAAANDFLRMSEQCEDMVQDIIDQGEFTGKLLETLQESSDALVSLFSGDAVYAAQMAHIYIFKPIWEEISDEFFSAKWETELTHNELALKVTRTLDDYMADLETFLDEFMLKKTVDALVAASVVFYVKCFLLKAEKHNSNKKAYFINPSLALERMDKDIKVFKDYFDGLSEGMPALGKVIEKEFQVLTTFQELIRIAIGDSETDATDFIVVLHKKLKDINITKHVVGDIWHLIQPTEERMVWELIESLEDTLIAVCPNDDSVIAQDRMSVTGLRLDETLAKLYIESKRKRPVVAGAVEKMVTSLRKNWTDDRGDQ